MIPIVPIDPSVTLVHHFLERSARLYPDKIALIHGKIRATYSEINERAENMARHLVSIGAQPADRVALLMENCLEYVVSYYGILKAGAVAVPLNNDLKPDGLRFAINDLGAKVLIADLKFEKVIVSSNLQELGMAHLLVHDSKGGSRLQSETTSIQKSFAPPHGDGDSLASIIYTSGSTGGPKGVMLSHRNIVDNTFSICQYLKLTHNDIQMVVLPFFYVMGKSLLNTHFAVGGTVVINNQFAFPAAVIKEMISEKVTGFSGVPSTFAYLVHRSPLAKNREKLTSLRYVSQAGGHMSRAVKEELKKALPPGTEIVIMYGATEAAARLSYLGPEYFNDKMDSIGKAIPGVELKIVKDTGEAAGVREVGELVASGTNIMRGYWRNQEATEKALDNGWYRTGDQAYMDEDGFFFLVGRKDDLLKVGGHRLNPQEIEDVLMESGLFVEVVVIGVPDEILGNKLVILAVPAQEGCSENEVLAYCVSKLPKFKVPGEVRLVRSLPKKSSGKIDRKECRSLFLES